jgi:hypothetical protein
MPKWEYTTLRVVNETVMRVNDQQVGDIKTSLLGGSKEQGSPLHQYLNKIGQDGWEVAGMTPITGGSEHRAILAYIVVLKRPLS